MLLFRRTPTSRLSLSSDAFTSSIYRLLSTSSIETTPSPASNFAVQYLVESWGLPPDKAALVSRRLPHLKSPEKPNSVLQFLRNAGISEHHIQAAALRDPYFLSCNVERCMKPRMAELEEIGFSSSDISLLFSLSPRAFQYTRLQQQVKLCVGILNSVEDLMAELKRNCILLSINPDTVSANVAFLKEQYGFSVCQIARLLKSAPRLLTSKHETLKNKVQQAEKLGVKCSSGMFVYALIVVSGLKQSMIDSRLNNLRNLGFSQEELTLLVSRLPLVLTKSEEVVARQMKFLTKEAGCDNKFLISNPSLFTFSLGKRLIPRNLVKKILQLKGSPVGNKSIAYFVNPTEKNFVEKFVRPYEHAIPGLHRAYEDVCAGNNGGLEWFKSNSI